MISVGSRDGRKGTEGLRAHIEMELEEGEAYQDEDDISFDYIDQKLQDVLGHFKKDFEAGLSAENLGAKFGGYGSFLPVYQRSPISSHSRSPPKVQSSYTPRSPDDLAIEGGHQHASAVTELPHPTNGGSVTADSESHVYKAPSRKESAGRVSSNRYMQSVEESNMKSIGTSANLPDQKTLKVRIKVGSDNLATKKNSAIYSGLGLDVSPSSSFGDSPVKSPGISHGITDASDESPTLILEIMSTFPIHGGHLLSPLPDGLVELMNTGKLLQCRGSPPTSKIKEDFIIERVHNPVEFVKRSSVEGSTSEKSTLHVEPRRGTVEESSDLFFKKEEEFDIPACDELISDALRLPLLSNSPDRAVGSHGGGSLKSPVGRDLGMNEKSSTASPKGKSVDLCSADDNGWDQMQKRKTSSRIHANDRKQYYSDLPSHHPQEGGNRPRHAISNSDISNRKELHSSERSKISLTSGNGHQKQKSREKSMSHEHNGMDHPSGRAHSSSKEKKKPKKRQTSVSRGEEGSKAGKACATSVHDNLGNNHNQKHKHKNKVDSFAIKKESRIARDKYKDFFGDMDDMVDDPLGTTDILGSGLKSQERTEIDVTRCGSRLSGTIQPLTSEIHSEGVLNVAPPPETRAMLSDAAIVDVVDWVCCDKCQTWRLLPPGIKDSLPEKWICSMMTWLPGMNHCSFSEEETTKALQALHNLPTDKKGHPVLMDESKSGPATVKATGDPRKKKYKPKEVSGSSYQVDRTNFSNLTRKPIKSPSVRKPSLSNSADTVASRHKIKEKNVSLGSYSDGGSSKNSKNKRGNGNDENPSSKLKKMKIANMLFENGDMAPTGGESHEKMGVLRIRDHPNNDAGQLSKHSDLTKEKYQPCDSKQVSKKSEFEIQGSMDKPSEDGKKFDDSDITLRKRKFPDSQKSPVIAVNSAKLNYDVLSPTVKKARVSKNEEKKSSSTKEMVKTEKKPETTKDQCIGSEFDFGTTQDSKENVVSVRKSVVSVGAATSSSSKVSGSLKIKSEVQEAKGSPVDSVSSSPARNSKRDSFCGRNKNHGESKDRSQNAPIFNRDGLRGCSDDAENDSYHEPPGTIGKNPSDAVSLHGCQNIPPTDVLNVSRGDKVKVQMSEHPKVSSEQAIGSLAGTLQNGGDRRLSDVNGVTEDKSDNEFNRSWSKKSDDSSCRSKDKNKKSRSNLEKGKVNMSESCSTVDELPLCEDKMKYVQERDERKSSWNLYTEKSEPSVTGRDKFDQPPPSSSKKNEIVNHCPRPGDKSSETREDDAALKEPVLNKRSADLNRASCNSSKHQVSNGHRIRNDAPNPSTRDSTTQAATSVVKEAKDLKHRTDRLKNVGSIAERTGLYFQAALKFLHGAALFESSNENQSKQIYSDTAKLCKFCAHEFEKSKDMAAAALSYKCMEVAYLRVIYFSHSTASRDRHDIQSALQIAPLGESPSSSASDIDNSNHPATGDKIVQRKGVNSPQVVGSHVVAARNRPDFMRLLDFARDVNFAMEASKKSRAAYAAAESACAEDAISSVKSALDFNFHDVEGLLRLVRLAMEAISR